MSSKTPWFDRHGNTTVEFFMQNLGLTCGEPPLREHVMWKIDEACGGKWALMRPHYQQLIASVHVATNLRHTALLKVLNYEIESMYGFNFRITANESAIRYMSIDIGPMEPIHEHGKKLKLDLPEMCKLNPNCFRHSPNIIVPLWGDDNLSLIETWLKAVYATIMTGHMLSKEMLYAAMSSNSEKLAREHILAISSDKYRAALTIRQMDDYSENDYRVVWMHAIRPEAPYKVNWLPTEPLITQRMLNKYLSATAQQMIGRKIDEIMLCRRYMEKSEIKPYHVSSYQVYT